MNYTLLNEHVCFIAHAIVFVAREELRAEEFTKFQAALMWSKKYCDSSPVSQPKVKPERGKLKISINSKYNVLPEHTAERDHGHLPDQHFLPQNSRQRPNERDLSAQRRSRQHHNERVSIISAMASGLKILIIFHSFRVRL